MKGFLKKYEIIWKRIIIGLADILVILFSGYFALLLRFEFNVVDNNGYYSGYTKYVWINLALTLLIFWAFRLYHSLWNYAGITEIRNIAFAVVTTDIVHFFLLEIFPRYGITILPFTDRQGGHSNFLPTTWYVLYPGILFLGVTAIRLMYRTARIHVLNNKSHSERVRTMIVGAGETAHMVIRELQINEKAKYKIACIIDDDRNKIGSYFHGVKVIGDRNTIIKNCEKYEIQQIIICMPSASRSTVKEITNICKETGCELKITPSIEDVVGGNLSLTAVRDVSIEDLLGREPVRTDLSSIMGYVSGKVVMVTGGGGSIGSELCRQIAKHNPKMLIIYDIYENNAYDIQQELLRSMPELNLVTLIGSVRNTARLDDVFTKYRPELIYHAAAHKHVPLMEVSPGEAVKNNVLGTLKLVQAADKFGVSRFVMISTDKAVNPTNVMGATKRICEMIIQTYNNRSNTEFVAVRFGNVLGSNGSVIPLFKKQIAEGGPVTVTHPDIIRFFMTIPEAVSLVLQAGAYAKGGEIFVLEMGEPVRILDLAENLIKLSGYVPYEDMEIKFTGLRPGEKLYEEKLMSEEGLQMTDNKLIHIGKPLEIDEEKFLTQLESLKPFIEAEPSPKEIRERIKQIVTTYHPTAQE